MSTAKMLTFKTADGRSFTGQVKNPSAKLGAVAGQLAATKAGIAGSFEIVDSKGSTVDPNTRLADLPADEELTLASELTPA